MLSSVNWSENRQAGQKFWVIIQDSLIRRNRAYQDWLA